MEHSGEKRWISSRRQERRVVIKKNSLRNFNDVYVIVCLEQLIICCFNFWIIIVRALHRGPIFSNFSLVRNITIVKIFSLYSVYFHKLISCFKIFWNFIDIKYWYRYIKYLYLLKYKKMQMIKEKNPLIV